VGISWVLDCKKIQKTQTHETCHRVILWVDFSVGRGSAVGCTHACALARLHRFVLLSAGTLRPTIRAMVSIRGHAYGRWVRRRRALAARLIVMRNMGYFLDELGVLLRAFRRAPKEVALLKDHSLHVTAASLNLKRSSLGVQRRRFFFCLLHGSQSPGPTPTSPHPSLQDPLARNPRSARAHRMPTQSPSPPRPLGRPTGRWPPCGARQTCGCNQESTKSAGPPGARERRRLCPSRVVAQQPKHQAKTLEAPPPAVPLKCPAMRVSRPKACGYRPLDTHVWVGLFYRRGSL